MLEGQGNWREGISELFNKTTKTSHKYIKYKKKSIAYINKFFKYFSKIKL